MSKSVDDAIRIRDNQRRSRARRKDLIKDLQARVQEYEKKGVTATLDMQRAARKVAQENERLRTLLTRHGILKEEINSFLRSCEQTEGSSEPETPSSSVRSQVLSNPYPTHAGPRSLSIQPLSQAYSRDRPHPSPISSRPTAQIARQPMHTIFTKTKCGPETECGPPSSTSMERQGEHSVMARPVEACRKVEAYYASPSETEYSTPSRHQGAMPSSASPECAPATVQSQGCCPSTRPPPEVSMEDPDCPSTADCFCPPATTAPVAPSQPAIGSDEISCETAATIIAQMRGDGDEAAARASIGCAPQQMCNIKNAFLMQVLDER